MHQTNHFFNLGYGWLCKHCTAENSERKQRDHASHPHATRESKTLALAKWIDEERNALACPRCGIVEQLT